MGIRRVHELLEFRGGELHRRRTPRLGATVPLLLSLTLVVAWILGPGTRNAAGQFGGEGLERCELLENRYVRSLQAGQGHRITYISGPVLLECQDGSRIRADSTVEFTANRFRQLIGSVRIDAADYGLRAGRVDDFQQVGRVEAWDGVVVVDSAQGARIAGDSLRLLRALDPGEVDRMTVWGEDTHAVLRLSGGVGRGVEGLEEEEGTGEGEPEEEPEEEPGEEALEEVGPAAPAAEAPPPDSVFADRIHLEGRSTFRAGGSVEVRREGLVSYSDSLEFYRGLGEVVLIGDPRIESDQFDLEGESVELLLGEEGIHFVRARKNARLEGEDVLLTAPEIRVFLEDGVMDRLVAVDGEPEEEGSGEEAEVAGGAATAVESEGEVAAGEAAEGDGEGGAPNGEVRPRARSEEFVLVADSIEVNAPAQALERIFAAGEARGEALGRDSLNTERTPEIARRDWIEGDTVVAHFQPDEEGPTRVASAAPRDPDLRERETRRRLERLVAIGAARSLYRLRDRRELDEGGDEAPGSPPEDAPGGGSAGEGEPSSRGTGGFGGTPRGEPALHYVTGRKITIVMSEGEVERMEVEGQTQGLYLQPGRPNPGVGRPLEPDTLTPPEPPREGGGP